MTLPPGVSWSGPTGHPLRPLRVPGRRPGPAPARPPALLGWVAGAWVVRFGWVSPGALSFGGRRHRGPGPAPYWPHGGRWPAPGCCGRPGDVLPRHPDRRSPAGGSERGPGSRCRAGLGHGAGRDRGHHHPAPSRAGREARVGRAGAPRPDGGPHHRRVERRANREGQDPLRRLWRSAWAVTLTAGASVTWSSGRPTSWT